MPECLRIAVVHYHLRRGGVTRVIEHAAAGLRSHPVRLAVCCGEAPRDSLPVPCGVVDGLGYAEGPEPPVAELAATLDREASRLLGGPPDLWHIHNHSLGKNLAVPRLVRHWAVDGRRLLLQLHDFAEDGRPLNYRRLRDGLGGEEDWGNRLYPQGGGLHYAALNRRDEGLLRRAGAALGRVHLLPNPVSLPPVDGGEGERGPVGGPVLYPTRAIRRKNLGEVLLWAAASGGRSFAVTLAPENPAARPVYDQWVALAEELKLPIAFDVGRHTDFSSLLAGASALLSTSVAEGFGLAFLEPWLAGRGLLGRNLPEVTADFEEAGVDLGSLYPTLGVPLAWVGLDELSQRVEQALQRSCRAYGRAYRADMTEQAVAAAVDGDEVDFGRLDEELQQDVIRRVAADPSRAAALNPPDLGPVEATSSRLAGNAARIRASYSVAAYGDRLWTLYRAMMEETPSGPDPSGFSAARLLDGFLAPERFMLLRT